MTEDFLHYIWKFKLFDFTDLHTQHKEKVRIINAGEHNTHAGPDFFNAKIKIGKTTWAGNVEIHTKSSEWFKHHHQKDKAYKNVILHVVFENDLNGSDNMPTIELKNIINSNIHRNYLSLIQSSSRIPCQNHIHTIDEFYIKSWLDRLVIERLERKTASILSSLKMNHNNWEETFYQFLARNFGLKINAEPFELLAKSLPVKVLAKHKNNLHQIEALLFGQAGLLNRKFKNEYPNALKKEYRFLQKKFSLKPIELHLWKFLRLRPANFPTIRIAQFAQLIFQSSHLFSKILECKTVKELDKPFNINTSAYWDTHYNFDTPSTNKKKKLGKTAVNTIIINTIIPFLFIYGKQKANNAYQKKALQLLENIPSENNNIIKNWQQLKVRTKSAYDSQALLQLKNEYCNNKKCLYCVIGNKILTK